MELYVDGVKKIYEGAPTYEQIAQSAQSAYPHQIVLAVADGKIKELFREAKQGARITFLTTGDKIGHDTPLLFAD